MARTDYLHIGIYVIYMPKMGTNGRSFWIRTSLVIIGGRKMVNW